jgi:hypothetical protein
MIIDTQTDEPNIVLEGEDPQSINLRSKEQILKIIEKINVNNWSYLREGNSHIIAYYKGTNKFINNFILRIKKNTHNHIAST